MEFLREKKTKECIELFTFKMEKHGTSLVVQWLSLRASNARSAGSLPRGGTKILHAAQRGQKKKKKKKNEEAHVGE